MLRETRRVLSLNGLFPPFCLPPLPHQNSRKSLSAGLWPPQISGGLPEGHVLLQLPGPSVLSNLYRGLWPLAPTSHCMETMGNPLCTVL